MIPSVPTVSSGQATATLNGDQLSFTGSFSNLTGALTESDASLHVGYAGRNGDATLFLVTDVGGNGSSGSFAKDKNTFTVDATLVEHLIARRLYIQIKSSAYPDGEIRGQLLPTAEMFFEAPLSGSGAVPSAFTEATGNVVVELRGDEVVITGGFQGMTTPALIDSTGGSHIHFTRFADSGNTLRYFLKVHWDDDMKGGVLAADSNAFKL